MRTLILCGLLALPVAAQDDSWKTFQYLHIRHKLCGGPPSARVPLDPLFAQTVKHFLTGEGSRAESRPLRLRGQDRATLVAAKLFHN